jgi:predicted dehydrogenase
MAFQPVRTAIVGCGNISSIYCQNLPSYGSVDLVACADLDRTRAEAQAARFNIPRVLDVDEVLADPEIELIVNLTIPAAHGSVGLAAVRANKSVYNEKPLTIDLADAQLLLAEAQQRGVLVGGAPDTFLGGGVQTCGQLLNQGAIGQPVAATAFMLCHGHESWHPNPEFYYQPGGGPMFDMGPYYLTALIALLGPIRRVTSATKTTFAERMITSQPKRGTSITVETPTHLASVLEFANASIATLVTSFDVWHAQVPQIELYGTEGSMSIPSPNDFGGSVRVRSASDAEWHEVPLTHGYSGNDRGIGVADMAAALRQQRPHRASGALAFHVLETMHAIHAASDQGWHIELASSCERPLRLPAGKEPLDWTTVFSSGEQDE